MVKEIKRETEVRVGLEMLWQALSKDFSAIAPKVFPEVKDVQVIEGDGGVGTILLITHHCPSSGSGESYQKEKISELDASTHEIGFEYIEGGFPNQGFSYYKASLKLSAKGEHQTVVNTNISYELPYEEAITTEQLNKTLDPVNLNFLRSIEKHLSISA